MTLPTGTVTFLFTDIEGSTRLMQELGEKYVALQVVHHELLRNAFRTNDGRELRTEGDSRGHRAALVRRAPMAA